MIDEILSEINNHFVNSHEYSIITITGDELTGFSGTYIPGQYINIYGSVLNDGTYKILSNTDGVITLTENLINESSHMSVFGLKIPKAVIDLSTKVSTYSQTAIQGLSAESQGNRSVTYKDGSSWQSLYKNDLNAYRSAFDDRERWLTCGRPTLLNYW